MRSQDEIIARIKTRQEHDFFGFEIGDYMTRLTVDNFKPFAKDGADLSDWVQSPGDREAVLKELCEYATFAWHKANNCRGLSASRSLSHFIAWSWLAGDDAVSQAIIDAMEDRYECYGKPILARICEHYGIDWKALDNGDWVNGEDGPSLSITDILSGHPALSA